MTEAMVRYGGIMTPKSPEQLALEQKLIDAVLSDRTIGYGAIEAGDV